MTGYRYAMAGCLALNVVAAVQLMSQGYQDPKARSVVRLVGAVVPAMIHGMIYKKLSAVQNTMRGLGRTELSDSAAAEAGNLALAGQVREKLRQMDVSMLTDVPRFLLGIVALMAANFVLSNA